jgi:hypothetical protein
MLSRSVLGATQSTQSKSNTIDSQRNSRSGSLNHQYNTLDSGDLINITNESNIKSNKYKRITTKTSKPPLSVKLDFQN